MLGYVKYLGKIAYLKTMERRRLYVLNFHIIGSGGHGTSTTPEHFERTLDWLRSNFNIVALNSWLEAPSSGPCAAITFDDGHRSVSEIALPMLRARNIPATLFVNTGYWDRASRGCWSDGTISDLSVGGEGISDLVARARNSRDPEEYRQLTQMIEGAVAGPLATRSDPYMSRDEVFALDDPLLSIGLHGHLHHRHSMFDPTWEEENIVRCRDILVRHPFFVPIFAAPFGKLHDVTAHTAGLCKASGLRLALNDGGYVLPEAETVRRIASDQRDVGLLIRTASPIESRRSGLPEAVA